MTIYANMYHLKTHLPKSRAETQSFLDTLAFEEQDQVVGAACVGRANLHREILRQDFEVCRNDPNDLAGIPRELYARFLFGMSENLPIYFDTLVACADEGEFDLETM